MTARPRTSRDVMSAGTLSTGGRNLRTMNEQPPPRGALFFCNFSFGQAKEKLILKIKVIEAFNRSNELGCVYTIELRKINE